MEQRGLLACSGSHSHCVMASEQEQIHALVLRLCLLRIHSETERQRERWGGRGADHRTLFSIQSPLPQAPLRSLVLTLSPPAALELPPSLLA